jgi:hypothetical protein
MGEIELRTGHWLSALYGGRIGTQGPCFFCDLSLFLEGFTSRTSRTQLAARDKFVVNNF